MADVLNKTTKELLKSVNTPDYSSATWFIMGRAQATARAQVAALQVALVPNRYWKIDTNAETVVEMSSGEKDTVDTANAAADRLTLIPTVRAQAEAYLNTRYDADIATRMMELWAAGNAGRKAAVATVIAWKDTVLVATEAKVTAYNGSSMPIRVAALDFSTFNATDPVVTIAAILAL